MISNLENAALDLQRSLEYLIKALAGVYEIELSKNHRIDSVMYLINDSTDFFFTDYDRCHEIAKKVSDWKINEQYNSKISVDIDLIEEASTCFDLLLDDVDLDPDCCDVLVRTNPYRD